MMFRKSEDGSLSQGMSSSGEDISLLMGMARGRAPSVKQVMHTRSTGDSGRSDF